jgi:hypothetical protein
MLKKIFLLLTFLFLFTGSRAQLSMENIYSSSAGLTKLALSGYKYFVMDVANSQCRIYNMNHSLWKTINLPIPAGMYLSDIKYVSETLFNLDSKVELAYIYYSYDTTYYYYTYGTRVLTEDGVELLNIPGGGYVDARNTDVNGTKFMVYVYDYSVSPYTVFTRVYALPGQLITSDGSEIQADGGNLPAYPNPARSVVTIPYTLPEGMNEAELIITDTRGTVIRSFLVDRTFSDLSVDISGFPRGVYFYRLLGDTANRSSGKFIAR